jgi:hypothetical protein
MMKGPYVESYKLGLAMGFLPKEYGGGSVSNIDLQIVAEEVTAVSARTVERRRLLGEMTSRIAHDADCRPGG